MAGFLNAFNKSFERPGEQADIDPNEQRRYAKMAQEDMDIMGYDSATDSITANLEGASQESISTALNGVEIPSINGDTVELTSVNGLTENKDGSWSVNVLNKDGTGGVLTDSSDRNPNAPVTRFTTEQIKTAITNKYIKLASMSGGPDQRLIQTMIKDLGEEVAERRIKKLFTFNNTSTNTSTNTDASSGEDDSWYKQVRTSIPNQAASYKVLEDVFKEQGNIEAIRGLNTATPEEIETYGEELFGSKKSWNEAVSKANDAKNISFNTTSTGFTERAGDPSGYDTEIRRRFSLGESPSGSSQAASAMFQSQAAPTPELGKINFTSQQPGDDRVTNPVIANVPVEKKYRADGTLKPASMLPFTDKEYARDIGRKYVDALANESDNPEISAQILALDDTSWIKTNPGFVGAYEREMQQADKISNAPAGTTLLQAEELAKTRKIAADKIQTDIDNTVDSGEKNRLKHEKSKLLSQRNILRTAILNQNVLSGSKVLGISEEDEKELEKVQRRTASVSTAIATAIRQKEVSEADSIQNTAAELAKSNNITSVELLTQRKRGLKADMIVANIISAVAYRASMSTDTSGNVTMNKNIFDSIYNKNWNLYTTGNPNMALADMSASKATRLTKKIDRGYEMLDTIDTFADVGQGLIDKQTDVAKSGILFFIRKVQTGAQGNPEEYQEFTGQLASNIKKRMNLLKRLKEEDYRPVLPEATGKRILRLEKDVARDFLIHGIISRKTDGIAAWVKSWGTDIENINAFTDLNNFRIVTGENDEVTESSKIVFVNSDGEVTGKEITVKNLFQRSNVRDALAVMGALQRHNKAKRN